MHCISSSSVITSVYIFKNHVYLKLTIEDRSVFKIPISCWKYSPVENEAGKQGQPHMTMSHKEITITEKIKKHPFDCRKDCTKPFQQRTLMTRTANQGPTFLENLYFLFCNKKHLDTSNGVLEPHTYLLRHFLFCATEFMLLFFTSNKSSL